jgi:hypothetical protein
MASLPDDAGVQVVGAKATFLDALEEGQDPTGGDEKARALDAVRPSALELLEDAAPDVAPFVTSLLPLAEGERNVAAVPFAITVR